MKQNNFIFKYNDITLPINNGFFISIVGNNNEEIYNTLIAYKKINFISYRDLFNNKYDNVFDEINSIVKNKNKSSKIINEYNLNNQSISDRVKLKIIGNILKDKTLIINNILNLLDMNDYKTILKALKLYSLKGHIVINLTNISEETLFSDKTIVIYNNKLLFNDESLNVLNNEKLMKRIGIGLPFIVELNKYLMDYNLIDNYYLSNKKLVGALWK